MKIAIIGSRGYPSSYGGFETFVARLAPFAASQGHSVTVYGRGPFESRFIDGVRVVNVPDYSTKNASTLTYGFSAVMHAKKQSYDVILFLNPAMGLYIPFISRTPTVLNPDGLEWRRGKWGLFARAAFLAGAATAARKATAIVTDSRAIGRYWICAFGRAAHYIPYGADVTSISSTDSIEAFGLSPRIYSLVVARLAPENNVDMILDAHDKLDRDHALVVVGDSNYPSPVQRRLQKLQDNPRVLWLGRVRDQDLLTELWANALVYIHGHSVGGTNPALLQAMGHGAGPLAFHSPFNREVLGDPNYLFSSAEELASLWCKIIDNPAGHEAWREKCQGRIEESYSWHDVCHDYLDLLKAASLARSSEITARRPPRLNL